MHRLCAKPALWLGVIAGLSLVGGCTFKCETNADDKVEKIVDKIGDKAEDVADEVNDKKR
ncbi:MAG: hypothetical protein JNG88_13765 [Phycisphaerales bacterium]|nr:hypothetical protein [Phycisphaerales bacterium]